MKKYTCTVNDSWMSSLESAFLSVTSPSGKSLTLNKIHLWNRKPFGKRDTTDYSIIHEIRDLVTEKIQADDRIRIFYDIDLTVDQMQRFKDLVDIVKQRA